MGDVDTYLEEKRAAIDCNDGSIDWEHLLRMVEYSQLLAVVGRHQEAKPYATKAWEASKYLEADSMYSIVYYNAGANLAGLLDFLNEVEECGKVFLQLEKSNPTGTHLGDYAYFLHRRKREFDKAEICYKRALELYPDHSSIHLKYAGFLRHVRRNVAAAGDEYRRAVETNPANADALGNYASFLHGVQQNVREAESYYQQAVNADDTHANNLCNYGLFLSEEKQDFAGAEKMYRRVLAVTPTHANTLYNFAVLLDTHLQRKSEAEKYYRSAVDVEPRHAFALYNLAVLLEERYAGEGLYNHAMQVSEDVLKQRHEVAVFYQRAAEADPRDSTTLADYARYLFVRLTPPPPVVTGGVPPPPSNTAITAESLFQAAIKLDPACEVALYHLALLSQQLQRPWDVAYRLLLQLLQGNPSHANGLLTLARHTADLVQQLSSSSASSGSGSVKLPDGKSKESVTDEAAALYERAVVLSKEPAFVASEYLKFASVHGSTKIKGAAIKSMTPLVSQLASSSSSASSSSTAAGAGTATTSTGQVVTAAEALQTCRLLLDELRRP